LDFPSNGEPALDRIEGLAKLTGRERYVDDLAVDGCLWGMTVRSPSPRGRIREIRFDDSIDWSKFVVVDHRDLPGPNEVKHIDTDQPVLAEGGVRHVHEPVVLLAHSSRLALRRAVEAVTINISEEPPALDFHVPPTPQQIQFCDDNVFKHLTIVKGDVEQALADAPYVVEGTYRTGAQEHVYLEPQGMLAFADDGVMVVKGSMQCPYYVHAAMMHALSRSADRVRVIQAPTGGGFGGKEDYPSIIALHASLLALKARRPVKIVYDRDEDMAATTKRHPSWVRIRTGVDAEGRLLAQDIKVLLDGGAYVTLSPVVLSRAIIHAGGPYHCEHVRVEGKVVLTNSVPFGAFRGFGAPQTLLATERHMDRIARTIGLDPVDVRRVNLIRDGQDTATGQVIDDGVNREAILDQALALSNYRVKQATHTEFNAGHPYLRRGIGLATFLHGAGFTGAGEVHLDSVVHVAALPDGGIEVRTAGTEMGQGTTTVFTQLVADRLGLAPDRIDVPLPDTARDPNSGPTVASRTAMIVGRLVEQACDDLRRQLGLPDDARGDTIHSAVRTWFETPRDGPLIGTAHYQPPPGIAWDEAGYQGDAYGAFAWATYVAEVEVDLRTWTTRVLDFVAVQEVGKVLNETLARGQIQGGVVQGIGWGLMEECRWRDGAMENSQLTNYIVPTCADIPPVRVAFVEVPYPHGAQGAKGIGELPIDGPAPAILNAVAAATESDPCTIPLTPERLMELVPQ
jgi:CO/xanthine dehydrogenase Mo-binding subunit